jgi:hypothetical protein
MSVLKPGEQSVSTWVAVSGGRYWAGRHGMRAAECVGGCRHERRACWSDGCSKTLSSPTFHKASASASVLPQRESAASHAYSQQRFVAAISRRLVHQQESKSATPETDHLSWRPPPPLATAKPPALLRPEVRSAKSCPHLQRRHRLSAARWPRTQPPPAKRACPHGARPRRPAGLRRWAPAGPRYQQAPRELQQARQNRPPVRHHVSAPPDRA